MIIIYGYSKLSSEVATVLSEKEYSFTIIEENEENVQKALDDGHNAYISNLSEDENLIKAGISKSVKTLFCMSEDFNNNLFVALSCRALDKNLVIISSASSKEDETKMLLAGANRVINPYEIGAQRLFRLMRKPTLFFALDKILFQNSEIKFAEIEIETNSNLIGKELTDISIDGDKNLLIVGLQSKDEFIYDTNRTGYNVSKNDVLVVMGKSKDIENFKEEQYR